MARTAKNYRIVHASNLKATRAARRSKARFYKQNFKLPKPMHFVNRRPRPRHVSKSRGPAKPGFGWAFSRPWTKKHRFPMNVIRPRVTKSKVMKRFNRKFIV